MKNSLPKYPNSLGFVENKYKSFRPQDRKIIDDFLLMCGGSAQQTTLKKYKRSMVKFCDVLDGNLDKIDLKILRGFLGLLNESDLSNPSKNEIKKVVKRFLKEYYDDWPKRFKNLSDNGLICYGQHKPNKQKLGGNIPTPEEVEKLIVECQNLKYKALISLMFETGGRPEEILKLKWMDIDLGKGSVTLRSSKTKEDRTLPFQASIIHLQRWEKEYPLKNRRAEDFIFPGNLNINKHLSNVGLTGFLKGLTRRVFGEKFFEKRNMYPYLLRHSRSKQLQKQRLPTRIYEKFMGHSIATARGYGDLDNEDVREVLLRDVYNVKEISDDKKHELENEVEKLKERLNKFEELGRRFVKLELNTQKISENNKKLLELSRRIPTKV